jgi:alpha-methylacyl-CoA racemase
MHDAHNVARGSFVDMAGLVQPVPAPRFSRTAATVDAPPPIPGEHTAEALASWGVPDDTVSAWDRAGAIAASRW